MTLDRITRRDSFSQLFLAIMSVVLLISVNQPEVLSQASRQKARTTASPSPSGDWLLWGGRERNFIAAATELSSSWPAGGPRKRWNRVMGGGYYWVVCEGTTLYCDFRRR